MSEGEIIAVTLTASRSAASLASTNFTCGDHFYEEVEDTKDSVWVVQVVPQHARRTFMRPTDWDALVVKLSRFGVRTGIFDCSLDYRFVVVRYIVHGSKGHSSVA